MKDNRALTDGITGSLKEEIAREGLASDIPAFCWPASGPLRRLPGETNGDWMMESQCYREMLEQTPVRLYRTLGSFHKILAPIILPLKAFIRKLTRFLLEPMAEEINTCHRLTGASIEALQNCVLLQGEEIAALRQQLEDARGELAALRREAGNGGMPTGQTKVGERQ